MLFGFALALDGVLKSEKVKLPTQTDVTEARTSLVRLQRVYGLNVHDMFRGNYKGYVGSALDTDDAFLVSEMVLVMTLNTMGQ